VSDGRVRVRVRVRRDLGVTLLTLAPALSRDAGEGVVAVTR
jgi:hypothetical protein